MLHGDDAGMVSAIDLNKGRLRIFEETAKLQNVDDIVTAVHADLRNFSVSYWTVNRGKHLELLLEWLNKWRLSFKELAQIFEYEEEIQYSTPLSGWVDH